MQVIKLFSGDLTLWAEVEYTHTDEQSIFECSLEVEILDSEKPKPMRHLVGRCDLEVNLQIYNSEDAIRELIEREYIKSVYVRHYDAERAYEKHKAWWKTKSVWGELITQEEYEELKKSGRIE